MELDIFTLSEMFSTEDLVVKYFIEMKFIYEDVLCGECGYQMSIITEKTRRYFRCKRKSCRKKLSLFYGTILFNACIPLRKVMMIVYLWLNQVETMKIVQMTGFTHETVKRYVIMCQSIIASSIEEEDQVIGGEFIEVQLDEAKFGKRKYNRGHRVDGVWVFGGVEVTNKRKLFLKIIPDLSKH